MDSIMGYVGRHGYFYLTGQGYNTHLEKMWAVSRVTAEEFVPGEDLPISLDDLKAKLRQVEAKDSDLCANQPPIGANDMHAGTSGLTREEIEEYEGGFAHDPQHIKEQCIETINPADLRSPLVLRLAGLKEQDIGQDSISEFTRKAAVMNPAAVAQIFHMTCNAMFQHLLAINTKEEGLFGPVSTYFRTVEIDGQVLH